MNNETNGEKSVSLRERKKKKVYEDIENVALNLFLEKGYDDTSIKDIADVLMMSSRTFFRYFSSKEDLLMEPLRSIHHEGIKRIKKIDPETSIHSALRLIFHEIALTYQKKRPNLFVRYEIAKQAPSTSQLFLYALLEAEPTICKELHQTLNNVPSKTQLKFDVAIHMAAFRVSAEEWLTEEEETAPLVDIIDSQFNLLMNK